ncbi:MAG: hypothetical protein QM820_58165 [Minicystis sp.]
MRAHLTLRHALGFAVVALAAAFGALVGCIPEEHMIWFCLNPVTGKVDDAPYDDHNWANGAPDPCHCYDACGPAKSCPIVVDAGPLPLGCDAGDGG